jgi:cation transport regulator ChaC
VTFANMESVIGVGFLVWQTGCIHRDERAHSVRNYRRSGWVSVCLMRGSEFHEFEMLMTRKCFAS